MITALRDQLMNLVGLNEAESQVLIDKLNPQFFKAKATIIKAESTAKHIYFIQSGLLRTYHLQDGKEINTYFASDGQFISTFSSFITQNSSFEFLEAIEDSTVFTLSHQDLTHLYSMSPKYEKLGRVLAEKNYLCILDRTLLLQTKTAKEKYLHFIKTYSGKIVQRVPQLHIASFLGIAPESLSRIRKEIVRS